MGLGCPSWSCVCGGRCCSELRGIVDYPLNGSEADDTASSPVSSLRRAFSFPEWRDAPWAQLSMGVADLAITHGGERKF
ncbi:hypothetical protein JOE52_006879 [Bradyrhizobium canariense]|nr:hypothetical protein [Bradyrhizobium canariense]